MPPASATSIAPKKGSRHRKRTSHPKDGNKSKSNSFSSSSSSSLSTSTSSTTPSLLHTIHKTHGGSENLNIPWLRTIAIERGLDCPEVRRIVWPLLLGPDVRKIEYGTVPENALRDRETMQCDVVRSLWRLVPMTQTVRDQRREELRRVMVLSLKMDDTLCYYQGFHEIAAVLLLTCGEVVAGMVLQSLCRCYLRPVMYKDFRYVQELQRQLHPLLLFIDEELACHLLRADMHEGHYALSWVLTWFAHVLDEKLETIARLFDFILATHPLVMPLYVSAVLVAEAREELLSRDADLCSLHEVIGSLPERYYCAETVLPKAYQLFLTFPPDQLLSSTSKSSPFRLDPDLEFPNIIPIEEMIETMQLPSSKNALAIINHHHHHKWYAVNALIQRIFTHKVTMRTTAVLSFVSSAVYTYYMYQSGYT
eukprot:PhM_4_TR10064/c0_g1_i1/m.88497/K20372/TBC1D20, GYP8; TBC1 domain family member 20